MADDKLQVIVIEEMGQFRSVLLKMLHRSGFEVLRDIVTENDAMESLLKTRVDVILCNWEAPERNGIKLLRFVRENSVTENVPFLLISDGLDEDQIAHAAEFEADGQLITPLSQKNVEDMINAVLLRREYSAEIVVRLARGGAFLDIGVPDEAVEEISAAQEIDPKSPRVWTKTGELYEVMGEGRKAKSCYQEAVKVDENYTKAYDRIGDMLQKEGKTDAALAAIKRATLLSPRNPDRQTRLAKAHISKGNVEEAREAIEAAVSLNPDEGDRGAAVAEFFLENGRADIAETEFVAALEANPDNIHYYNRLGIAFRQQKKYNEAIQNYRQALSVAPNDAVLYYNMALALFGNGDAYQATSTLRRAIVLNPDFQEAKDALKKLESASSLR